MDGQLINENVIATIIIALVAALPGIYSTWRQVAQDQREAKTARAAFELQLNEKALAFADKLEKDLHELEAKFDELKNKNIQLTTENIALKHQITNLEMQIEQLTCRVRKLEQERDILLDGIDQLQGQLTNAHLTPVWNPRKNQSGGE